MNVVSFYQSTEVDLDEFKSQTAKLIHYIKGWGEYYDGQLVINGSTKPVTEYEDELDAFANHLLDNTEEVEGEVKFPNDSAYIVKQREHNDIEEGELEIKQSLALISPYDGQVDSINIQLITKTQTVDEVVEGLEWEDGLGFFVHIADDNGNFKEMDV